MPTASRPTFMRRFAGAMRPVPSPDPADMGTACGLDFSLEIPERPAAVQASPSAVRPVAPWRIWLGRKLS